MCTNFRIYFILYLMITIFLISCTSKEPTNSEENYSILGNWYSEYEEQGYIITATISFLENNVFNLLLETSDQGQSITFEYSGVYNIINNNIIDLNVQYARFNEIPIDIEEVPIDTSIYWLGKDNLQISQRCESYIQLSGNTNQLQNNVFYSYARQPENNTYYHTKLSFVQDSLKVFLTMTNNSDFPISWDYSYKYGSTIFEKEIILTSTDEQVESAMGYIFKNKKLYLGSRVVNYTK